jgi:hypothetical protein
MGRYRMTYEISPNLLCKVETIGYEFLSFIVIRDLSNGPKGDFYLIWDLRLRAPIALVTITDWEAYDDPQCWLFLGLPDHFAIDRGEYSAQIFANFNSNRAGPNGETLTLEQIVDLYGMCKPNDD